jgi:hypothetical protein
VRGFFNHLWSIEAASCSPGRNPEGGVQKSRFVLYLRHGKEIKLVPLETYILSTYVVTVSSGSLHHEWCGIRGPDRGFGVLLCLFWVVCCS